MKKTVGKLSRLLLIAAAVIFMAPTPALAQVSKEPSYNDGVGGFLDNTYFENEYVGGGDNYEWIGLNAHGSYSSFASVMPSWQSGSTIAGGGAVGTNALNVAANESNSQTLKQALYSYLMKVNKNQLHSSNTPAGEWDRMGSALVVHTMLGEKYDNAGRDRNRTISDSDWATLKMRLIDNPDIEMTRDTAYSVRENTGGIMVGPGFSKFDAARYVFNTPQTVDSWIFRDKKSNTMVYALEIVCANPLGALPGLPVFDVFSLTPTVTAPNDGTVVNIGQTIAVTDTVRNAGPSASLSAKWPLTVLTFKPGTTITAAQKAGRSTDNEVCDSFFPTSTSRLSCDVRRNPARQVFQADQTVSRAPQFNYTVPSDMAPGTIVCFVSSVSPPRQIPTSLWRHSTMTCVTVASSSQFDLKPDVDIGRNDGSAVEPGELVTVRHTVTNEGQDPSPKTIWRLTKFVYSPTAVFDNNTQGARDSKGINDVPCNSFTSSSRTECDTVQEQTEAEFSPGAPKAFDPVFAYQIPDDFAVGTRVCFVSSVSKPTPNASPAWRHSYMWCVMVGKKPKMQVWGGDVRSGGKINTSTSTLDGKVFGSWGEYGALSHGDNSGFASGAALNNGNSNPVPLLWSKLTFANIGVSSSCASGLGCFAFSLSGASSVARQFAASGPAVLTGSRNLNDLASSLTPYRAGDLNLAATTISRGKTIIIVSTGTVTIDGDITYEDTDYTSIRDIPQVVIKAPKIDIRGSVGQVDAWLLATAIDSNGDGAIDDSDTPGVFNTCSDPASVNASLTVSDCNRQLKMNGPVVADIIYLRRTAGSEPNGDRGEPAEIFNLRADAYMWGSVYGSSAGRAQTVYSREVAPRF